MKKNLKTLFLCTSFLCFFLFIFLSKSLFSKESSLQTFIPSYLKEEGYSDLTGDGSLESLKIIKENDFYDVQITTLKETILLSKIAKEDHLTSNPISTHLVNISRDNKFEILVQGFQKDVPINYLFSFENNKCILKEKSSANIVGIIDSNMNRTPQIQFITKGDSLSFKNYMLIDKNLIDITKNTSLVTGFAEVEKFIDIIMLNYEIDNLPNIFHENIDKDLLSIIWQLDKDHFEYNFLDGFFYDSEIDENGIVQNIEWRLRFKKINRETFKQEILTFIIDTSRSSDDFKISNITSK